MNSRIRRLIFLAGMAVTLMAAALVVFSLLPVQDQQLQATLAPTVFTLPAP